MFGISKEKEITPRAKKISEISATGFKSSIKHRLSHYLVAVDESRKEWIALDDDSPTTCRIHKYQEIIDVEILRNDETVIKSSTAGAIGKGLVGGAIFGTAGAIVGGNAAQKTAETRITKLGIRVILSTVGDAMVYIDCRFESEKMLDQLYSMFVAMSHQGAAS